MISCCCCWGCALNGPIALHIKASALPHGETAWAPSAKRQPRVPGPALDQLPWLLPPLALVQLVKQLTTYEAQASPEGRYLVLR